MTGRERLLNALYGREVDRVPFAPFLAYFWEAQPAEVQRQGMLAFCKRMGADYMHRGSHLLVDVIRENCEVRERADGDKMYVEYSTPVGKITEEKKFVAESNTWFLTKHPVTKEEDFKVLIYILKNTKLKPNFERYDADKKYVGEEGLFIPVISPEMKTGFESLLEHWSGVEMLNYALYDFPELVEEALYYFDRNSVKSVEYSLGSSAEAFIFWEDTSTTMLNPQQFRQYVLPEIEHWGKLIHQDGKILIHHACGLIKSLYEDMCGSCVDFIESITPYPTGNIDMKDAFAKLPPEKGLIGGIDPVFFRNSSEKELTDYVNGLLAEAKGKRFILANSDSCPPDVDCGKFKLVSELVKKGISV